MTESFPDRMFVVFVGVEGMCMFSSNHASEEDARHQLDTLTVRHPTTSFGIAEYRKVDSEVEVADSETESKPCQTS